jgi:hypothetical protein
MVPIHVRVERMPGERIDEGAMLFVTKGELAAPLVEHDVDLVMRACDKADVSENVLNEIDKEEAWMS